MNDIPSHQKYQMKIDTDNKEDEQEFSYEVSVITDGDFFMWEIIE